MGYCPNCGSQNIVINTGGCWCRDCHYMWMFYESLGVLDCEYGQITSEELEEAFRKWWELGPAECDEDCLGKSELKKKEH